MNNLRPMTAWSSDGKRKCKFIPSSRIRTVHDESDISVPDHIRRMRMHGSTFEFIANVLDITPDKARELVQ